MARAGIGWGVRELAARATVATHTITRFESGEELKGRTVAAIQLALEDAGAHFVEEGSLAGVLVKKAGDPALTLEDLRGLVDEFCDGRLAEMNSVRTDGHHFAISGDFDLTLGGKQIGSLRLENGKLEYQPPVQRLLGGQDRPTEKDLFLWLQEAWGRSVMAESMG